MKKILFLFFVLFSVINANVFKYENGLMRDSDSIKYAMGVIDATEKNYEKLSKEEAYNELAKKIYSEINTNTSIQKILDENKESIEYLSNYNIKANLYLIGVDIIDTKNSDNKYYTLVSFDYAKNQDTYKKAVNEKADEINTLYKKLKNSTYEQKKYIYNALLKELESYNRLYFVSLLIGVEGLKKVDITIHDCNLGLISLEEKEADSIKNVTTKLIENLDLKDIKSSIKVLPFTYNRQSSFSSFSSHLQNEIVNNLSKQYKISSKDSEYTISGYYYVEDKTIAIYAYLYDYSGNVIATSNAKLKKANNTAYYIPQILKDDKETISSNLTLKAMINGTTEHQLLKKGDEVSIQIYATQECYVYAIDTFVRDNKEYQVLLPLKDISDKSQYEYKITSDEKRKNIDIGKFEVAPPFGVEKLTFFATSDSILDKMNISYTNIDGTQYAVYKINGKVVQNTISTTRGLIRPKNNKKDIKSSEFSIKFTSVRD